METINLLRNPSTDDGTFGTLSIGPQIFQTLELPWKNDAPDISCIPTGLYTCVVTYSPAFKRNLYLVENVPGENPGDPDRTSVRIHMCNWGGDKSLGKKCDLLGCIGLGTSVGVLEGQNAIIGSLTAVNQFMALLNNQPFQLNITNV